MQLKFKGRKVEVEVSGSFYDDSVSFETAYYEDNGVDLTDEEQATLMMEQTDVIFEHMLDNALTEAGYEG